MANHGIFITGGTGFLGTEVISRLIGATEETIFVLVRAKDEQAAIHRLKTLWYEKAALYPRIGAEIIPIVGDFEKKGPGIDAEKLKLLRENVSIVIHSGAEIGFRKDGDALEKTNREGTANVAAFAKELPKLERFVHISTAYVSGQNTSVILEDASVGTVFSSMYEKSKAEAETLVRNSGLPFVICRPGMIVGDSRTGWVRNFNTIYYVLKLLTRKLTVLPITRETRLNLVPVDYVAEAVTRITLSKGVEGQTFHLTCPTDCQPTAGELVDYVTGWAKENLNIQLPNMRFLLVPALKKLGTQHNRKTTGRRKNTLSNLLTLLPYFFGEQAYDRTNTDAAAGTYSLNWHDYIEPLLTFACRKNFMGRACLSRPWSDEPANAIPCAFTMWPPMASKQSPARRSTAGCRPSPMPCGPAASARGTRLR